MTPGLWGILTAMSWGMADFVTRFTGRAVGHMNALLGMLIVTSISLTLWVWLSGAPLSWEVSGLWLLVLAGVGTLVGTLTLYQSLTRGPVTIVAPIVSGYPALVVAIALVLGARLSAWQWLFFLLTMAGVTVVARSADQFEEQGVYARRELRVTVMIALSSALFFAVAISAGQHAAPIYGALQTVWVPRLVAVVGLIPLFLLTGHRPAVPVRWWPPLAFQGLLDAGGYLALFSGSTGAGGEIAAVTASGYAIVTVLLARIFLREAIGLAQWIGICMVGGGVIALSLHVA
ncbi:MAG: DMT family transporter [Thermoleophilia bacterium]